MNTEQNLRIEAVKLAISTYPLGAVEEISPEKLLDKSESIFRFINGDKKVNNKDKKTNKTDYFPTNYLTLYEFLGRAAHKELGKTVWEYSVKGDVPRILKNVDTKSYKGTVNAYPFDFLDDLFSVIVY